MFMNWSICEANVRIQMYIPFPIAFVQSEYIYSDCTKAMGKGGWYDGATKEKVDRGFIFVQGEFAEL